MKKYISLLLLSIVHFPLVAQQQPVITDMDGDGIVDTAFLAEGAGKILCALSSHKFKRVSSKKIYLSNMNDFYESKNGFSLDIHYNRTDNGYQFMYDKKAGKMRLIGYTCNYLGDITQDGSGGSSINLLTNTYIGNTNHYDEKKDKLIEGRQETIKVKSLPIYLDSFDDNFRVTFPKKAKGSKGHRPTNKKANR